MYFRFAGLALLLLAAAPPPTLTAEQLVTRNLAARGGAAVLGRIMALDFKGQYIAPGDFKLNFHETRARAPSGDRMRDDLSVQGLTIIQAYDGTGAWNQSVPGPYKSTLFNEHIGRELVAPKR